MSKPGYARFSTALLFSFLGFFLFACGSGTTTTSGTTSSTGMATVSISDPATCAGPSGPFAHVYVTISDIQVHTSATAAATDPGWVDLAPSLASSPKQIDLLGQSNNQCFLATLGATLELQAGTYQQIRIILTDSATLVSNNQCSGSGTANCVVLSADNKPYALQLSSEAKTGLKIPSGQIASGGFTIGAGQTKDLNIDFDTCASIVQLGNGQFRLKPVLHAGEVSTTSTSINGTVVDKTSSKPISGSVLVALEQKDSMGVDRIMMTTLAKADGTFVFCPISPGVYDVVVVASVSGGSTYAPAIVTGVSNGAATGQIALSTPLPSGLDTATLSGKVTTQSASNTGTAADVGISALETVSSGTYSIPLVPNTQQTSATSTVTTIASSSCATGTNCANYSLLLPAAGAFSGAYSTTGANLTPTSAYASYVIDGIAYVPSSGGTLDCSPSEQKSQTYALTAGGVVIAATSPLAFTQCQ